MQTVLFSGLVPINHGFLFGRAEMRLCTVSIKTERTFIDGLCALCSSALWPKTGLHGTYH